MKIIGHTETGYVAVMGWDELAVLTGATVHNGYTKIPIGAKLPVRDIYNTITNAQERKDSVRKAAALLRNQAETLESLLAPIIDLNAAVLPEVPK